MTTNLAYPFRGRWLTKNSPANRVPSHGTTLFAAAHAIDFIPVDDAGHSAPVSWSSVIRPEPATAFAGFGRTLLAPARGTVVAAHDTEPDHAAYRGLPSIGYALSQGRRAAAGWISLAGNHLMIESEGVIIALCHLQQGSLQVKIGQQLRLGDPVARCGNSGNSTEPHLHLQVIDRLDIDRAVAVPFMLNGSLPRNGEVVVVD